MVIITMMQVTSYSLSLHEIDTVRNSKGMITSAIEIMVRKEHIKILSDPLVKTLITTKWQRFAGYQFVLQAFLYLVFVVIQTFLVWLHCSANQWNQSSRQALEIVSILFACFFLLLEFFDLYSWTVQMFHRRNLMKANMTFVPPMYPIPGQMYEDPLEAKSAGLLSRLGERLFRSKGPAPLAEGVEKGPSVERMLGMEEGCSSSASQRRSVLQNEDHASNVTVASGSKSSLCSVRAYPGHWWRAEVAVSELESSGRAIAEANEPPGTMESPSSLTPPAPQQPMASSPTGSRRGSASDISDAAINGSLFPQAIGSGRHSPFKYQGMFPVDIVSVGLEPAITHGFGTNSSFSSGPYRNVSLCKAHCHLETCCGV